MTFFDGGIGISFAKFHVFGHRSLEPEFQATPKTLVAHYSIVIELKMENIALKSALK